MPLSVGVVFITHNAKKHLVKCLPPIMSSPLKPKVLVVNSSSNDGTVELAKNLGADVLIIPRNEFNHGLTRELARKKINTDIVIMMTPDAYALDDDLIEKLIQPILSKRSVVAYARQIAHNDSDVFENFPRLYNYPNLNETQIKTLKDSFNLGAKVFFCSDSCAAYLNSALDEVGGFKETLTAEDYLVVIEILKKGYAVAYVPDAIVKHSHRYSLKDEFKRHFDTGYIRGINKEIETLTGATEKAGTGYAIRFLQTVIQNKPLSIFYAIATLISKYFGFKTGYYGHKLPIKWKKRLSGQDYYWNSVFYKKKIL
jgi:rhamnosyltransferase